MSESSYTLLHADVLDGLRRFDDNSVDAVVTDPPYELGFMNKAWDSTGIAYNVEVWREALRVLKPGGHLLAFGGSRTYHRLASAVEDAGFEIRDQIMWVYGSGFPKSLDVSKAMDKAAGAEREVIGRRMDGRYAYEFKGTANRPTGAGAGTDDAKRIGGFVSDKAQVTAPATEAAKQWNGWGTALKPAHEPIVVARKPLIGTVVQNVLEHGTGALNIDACRVPGEPVPINRLEEWSGFGQVKQPDYEATVNNKGRWPANLIHDGSEEVLEEFAKAGESKSVASMRGVGLTGSDDKVYGKGDPNFDTFRGHSDSGTAARFFYCAKANKKDRGEGNNHPTVKPTELMRYLVRLVTPIGGLVLDPFCGSGSTGKAALLEGLRFIGIDREAEHIEIAGRRIGNVEATLPQLDSQKQAA